MVGFLQAGYVEKVEAVTKSSKKSSRSRGVKG
jgi:hypothetical protein